MEDLNTILLSGKILLVYKPNDVATILKLNVGNGNVVEIVAFNNVIGNIALKENDYISCLSNVQSSYRDGNYCYSFIANSIEKTNKLVMLNSAHIVGELINILRFDNFTKFIVKTVYHGHLSTFPVYIYHCTNDCSRFYKIGDRVFIGGSIQQYKNEKSEKKVYKQNIITSALHKVS